MKELIQQIAEALVDQPDKVRVSEVTGRHSSVIELSVPKEERGKVIGREGRTAQAMRTILSAASSKLNKRAILEIIE
ncbi:MAG: KH domain-containing protein [Deltaproteobacteria bacterium]|nr:KH domain-containing protein [Deltaproteobacteria bacterium]